MKKRTEILINGRLQYECNEDLINILYVLLRNDDLFRQRTLSYVVSLERTINV